MDIPIKASFRWTQDEFLEAQRVHMRHSTMGRKYRRTLFITAPLAVLFGTAILVARGMHPMGFFIIILGMVMFAAPLFVRRVALKHYSQRPDREMLVNWEFYPDRLQSRTEASSASLEWRMLSRVLQAAQGFLLYPNDLIYYWVPNHAFSQSAEREAFAQLAKSCVQRFDEVV